MANPASQHLYSRAFVPYFFTQALGALNDNAFRFAVMFLLTYHIADQHDLNLDVLMNLAAGLFILPFLLFSSLAGRITDQVNQAVMARILKSTELALMLAAALAFYWQNVAFLMLLIFLMGLQSAFFGPLKYAIMPRLLATHMLVRANGWVAMATFAAILTGTIIGGILTDVGPSPGLIAGVVVVMIAAVGLVAAWFIPSVPPVAEQSFADTGAKLARPWRWPKLIFNTWQEGFHTLRAQRWRLRVVLLLISWFWFIGSAYLTQFPRFAEQVLGLGPDQATALLATFALSIGAGGLAVGYLSGGKPRLWLAPIGALIVALAAFDWFYAVSISPSVTRVFIDVAITGVACGLFIVPLYTYLQKATKPQERARVIAGLNVQNALAMITASVSAMIFFSLPGSSLPLFFVLFGSTGLLVAILAFRHLRN